MSIARGYKRILGGATEATLGTKATSGWKYWEFDTEGLTKNKPEFLDTGIRGVPGYVRRLQAEIDISGSVSGSVYPEGLFPVLLLHGIGSVSSTQQGGTSAYKHDFAIVDDTVYGDTKGLTLRIERDVGTVIDKYGLVISSWTISSAKGGVAKATFNFIGINESPGSTPTATFPTVNPFLHHQATFSLAGTTIPISDWNFTMDNKFMAEIYDGQTRKKMPRSGRIDVTGTITKPYVENSDYADVYEKFINGTPASLTITFTGATIEGEYAYTLYFNFPNIYFNGPPDFASGGIENPTLPIPFRAYRDTSGNKEFTCYIISTETSIS